MFSYTFLHNRYWTLSSQFILVQFKAVKRRKRPHAEANNGNVFVCTPNNLQTNSDANVFVNSTSQHSGKNLLISTLSYFENVKNNFCFLV